MRIRWLALVPALLAIALLTRPTPAPEPVPGFRPSFDDDHAPPPPGLPRTVGADFGFEAHASAGVDPPDCALAVGPDHLVVPRNGRMRVFTKAGNLTYGAPLYGPSGFFQTITTGFAFDPVALFDPHSQRFFVIAGRRTPERIHLKVSADTDPNGTWFDYEFDTTPFGTDTDFPCLGIDANVLYIAVKMEDTPNDPTRRSFSFLVEKAPLLTGAVPLVESVEFNNNQYSVPFSGVTTYDPEAPAQYFATSPRGGSGGATVLRIRAVTDPLTSPQAWSTSVDITDWSALDNVPQLGTTNRVDVEPSRFYKNGVYRNGSLWVANAGAPGPGSDHVQVRWYEVSMNGWPSSGDSPSLAQEGIVDLGTNSLGDTISTFYPDLAVDAQGNLAIAFNRVSTDEYVSVARGYRSVSDAPGTLSEVVTVREGTHPHTSSRWGDYSTLREDPVTPGRFWFHVEYREAAWKTWVGSFLGDAAVAAPTVAPSPTGLSLAAAHPNPFRGRTSFAYALGRPAPATLTIHDAAGRRVRTLVDGAVSAGAHTTTWTGRSDAGTPVPAGVYFARLLSSGEVRSRKITHLP
ncbi:MAG: hypothetical protein DHS20C21_11120 [Gemmatimonadota bacterium]|nr:MAG: hypothetical protein DHS20C21_11120 [Gemmatimonadota bacterium]